MTQEKFKRACEIKANIDTIIELQNLLANAEENGFGTKYLAAIDVESFDSRGCIVENCNVLNHIHVPHKIMEQFNGVLQYELNMLEEEFKAL